jgi:uncharacterized membrane protein YfcA
MDIDLYYFVLAVFAGGLAQGVAGFGFGLVAMSLITWVLQVRAATVSIVFASLAVNIILVARLRKHFEWERVLPVAVSVALGVPLGLVLLMNVNDAILSRLLGALLLVSAAQGFIRSMSHRPLHPVIVGVPLGLASGALSAAFASGGPPLIVYMRSQNFGRLRYVVSMQLTLAVSGLARILVFGVSGMFDRASLGRALIAIVPAAGGAWLGLVFLRRLSEKAFRLGTGAVVGLLGVWYIVQ